MPIKEKELNCFFDNLYQKLISNHIDIFQIVHNTSNGQIIFGPVFNATFLKTVYKLQEEIKQIITPNNYTLANICFAPLTSPFTGPPTASQCVIQSIWGYWQDSIETFDFSTTDDDNFTVNYLDHFIVCSQ